MKTKHSVSELQKQLDTYSKTYDIISEFLATKPGVEKTAKAIAHRKHVLEQMLAIRMIQLSDKVARNPRGA